MKLTESEFMAFVFKSQNQHNKTTSICMGTLVVPGSSFSEVRGLVAIFVFQDSFFVFLAVLKLGL